PERRQEEEKKVAGKSEERVRASRSARFAFGARWRLALTAHAHRWPKGESMQKQTAKNHVAKLLVLTLLIENKGDVKARDLYKNTPLMCAVVAKHKEVEKFLRQRGAKP